MKFTLIILGVIVAVVFSAWLGVGLPPWKLPPGWKMMRDQNGDYACQREADGLTGTAYPFRFLAVDDAWSYYRALGHRWHDEKAPPVSISNNGPNR